MRLSNWIIVGLLSVLLIAAAAAVYTGLGTNKLSLVINTNGTNTYVTNETKLHGPKSEEMMQEIKKNAIMDVASPTSTDESIKSDVKNIASRYNYNANVKIISQYGIDELPLFATVNGTSMVPTLKNGQEILVLKTDNLKVGDIVVAIHPTYGLIVKRLSMIEVNQVYLTSDNKKVEIVDHKTTLSNGTIKTIKEQKSSLNTWLPRNSVVGVVMVK